MKAAAFDRPPLKVALMGLGRAMLNAHFPVLAANSSLFNVVAACELIKSRRDIVSERFPDCKMFRTFDDMLDERDIDLVFIALPAADRLKYVLKSLGRGYWTLVESPLALTLDEAKILRGAAIKAKNRLAVVERSFFQPDFMLAEKIISDKRIGKVQKIAIRREEFVRRNDWQAVRRMGGGAVNCQMPDLITAALRLMQGQPIKLWSDVKRIVATGDVEDYVHLNIVSRSGITSEIEYNGAMLPECISPSYTIVGSSGVFNVMPGENSGLLTCINPTYKLTKVRTSVRTPPIDETPEVVPAVSEKILLDSDAVSGLQAFWQSVYSVVRLAQPLPYTLDDSIEVVKFMNLVYKSSQFGR